MKQIDFDHGTVTGNILGAALPRYFQLTEAKGT